MRVYVIYFRNLYIPRTNIARFNQAYISLLQKHIFVKKKILCHDREKRWEPTTHNGKQYRRELYFIYIIKLHVRVFIPLKLSLIARTFINWRFFTHSFRVSQFLSDEATIIKCTLHPIPPPWCAVLFSKKKKTIIELLYLPEWFGFMGQSLQTKCRTR